MVKALLELPEVIERPISNSEQKVTLQVTISQPSKLLIIYKPCPNSLNKINIFIMVIGMVNCRWSLQFLVLINLYLIFISSSENGNFDIIVKTLTFCNFGNIAIKCNIQNILRTRIQ